MDVSDLFKCVAKIKRGEVEREKKVALMCLKKLLEMVGKKEFEKIKEDIIFTMISADPGNPLLFNFMKAVMKAGNKEKAKEIAEKAVDYIEKVPGEIAKYWDRIIRERSTVLVHSYSTNVKELLKRASQSVEFEVVVTEGSPTFWGRKMAEELGGLDVTLIPDTAINYIMPEIDLVLLGGLAVTKFGLIAPAGASMVALSANWNRIPVYAAVELLKVSERIIIRETELKVPGNIKSRAPMYDLTRNELLTAYITEEGIIKPERFYSLASLKLQRW